MADGRAGEAGRAGGADGYHRAVACANGWRRRRRLDTSTNHARQRYTLAGRARGRADRRREPGLRAGRVPGHDGGDACRSRKVAEAFRTGKGVGWHEHDPELFVGVERFFRPGYNANLVSAWIPALDGVQAKLDDGRPRRRRRLRSRRLDDHHGEGVSALDLRRLRLSPASIEQARGAPPTPASVDRVELRGRSGEELPGHRTTWWRASTACTTWAIRSVRPSTCASR